MGSGLSIKKTNNKYIDNIEYYKNNYQKEFGNDIKHLKRYFIFKGLKNNTIDLAQSIATGRLSWKNK